MGIRTALLITALTFGCLAPAASAAEPATETVSGFFREYAVDHPGSGPAIVAVDGEDTVWVALAKSGKLARFSNDAIELFNVGPESRPVGLAIEGQPNSRPTAIWIAASYDNKLVRFDPATNQTREYPIAGEKSWPFLLALGPDRTVWFTQRASGRIGRLDPTSGAMRHYEVPTPNAGPAGLAVDPRSGDIWFTESYADRIGRLDPRSGSIQEYRMGERSTGLVSGPAGLALDAAGGVWFAKLEGKLGHLLPGSDRIELIDVPPEAKRPAGLALARDGDVWALALDGNLLLRYRPATGRFTLYPIPTGGPDQAPAMPPAARTTRPFGLALDRQGNVWFSEQYTGQLAVLDTAPPLLSLGSPSETIRTAEPLVTVRALDRVAGVAQVVFALDGQPVVAPSRRLNLAHVPPGPHRLEVTATDAAGFSATTVLTFDYRPGPEALQRVRLLDGPPYFAPADLRVRKGDSVVWQYEPPSDGHTVSHNLHRIELPDLQVRSGLLRTGERFTYRFEQLGDFTVTDPEQPPSRAVIHVVEE